MKTGLLLTQAEEVPEARTEAWNGPILSAIRRSAALLTSRFQTMNQQNRETITFCGLSHLVCGIVMAALGN